MLRRVASVAAGLGVVVGAVALVNVATDAGSSTYRPPTPEEREGLVEVPQIASTPRLAVPSGLFDRSNPAHPPALVAPGEIRPGGPPPDGIPPIDAPLHQPAADVDWLVDSEPVVAVTVDGETRAYPIRILTWHEIVNDTIGDVPVTVSYCPLCNSAVAYDRRLDDETIVDFGTSGSLYNSSLVMYDRQSETLWTHFDGRAVIGHFAGTQLELIPVTTLAWAEFREAHRDALVLSRVTGFDRRYGHNPYPGYDDPGDAPFLFSGVVDGRLAAKERVVVVRDGEESVTIPWDLVAEAGSVEVDIAGRTVTVWHRAGTTSALDTSRFDEARDVGAVSVLEVPAALRPARTGDAGLVTADGTEWNLLGEAIDGPRVGQRLSSVEHLDTFWFAIAAFVPDTRLVAR